MSLSDRARALAALSALFGLSGCFQPMYGEASHPDLVEKLREVAVAPIPNRIGHYLYDDLITNLNGSGQTPATKYKLVINVSNSTSLPTVESQINMASSATLIANADFKLIKDDGEKVIYVGKASAAAPYDRTLQSFADMRAGRDAEIRAARSLAQDIELRVAAALGANP